MTAEILAADEATHILSSFQAQLNAFYSAHGASMLTHSQVAFGLSTSIRERAESPKKLVPATIMETFRSTRSSPRQSCPKAHYVADLLTIDNPAAASKLSKILNKGIYALHLSELDPVLQNRNASSS